MLKVRREEEGRKKGGKKGRGGGERDLSLCK